MAMTDEQVQQKVDAAREAVIQCASTMNADNEIDGWQGNVNVNVALDSFARVCGLQEARRRLAGVGCLWPQQCQKYGDYACAICSTLAAVERELEGL